MRVSMTGAVVGMRLQGLASKWKGAGYWLHQSSDGSGDGQRNNLLTQQQLNTTYASCPNPNAPITGSFRTTGTSGAIRVVSNGPRVF